MAATFAKGPRKFRNSEYLFADIDFLLRYYLIARYLFSVSLKRNGSKNVDVQQSYGSLKPLGPDRCRLHCARPEKYDCNFAICADSRCDAEKSARSDSIRCRDRDSAEFPRRESRPEIGRGVRGGLVGRMRG